MYGSWRFWWCGYRAASAMSCCGNSKYLSPFNEWSMKKRLYNGVTNYSWPRVDCLWILRIPLHRPVTILWCPASTVLPNHCTIQAEGDPIRRKRTVWIMDHYYSDPLLFHKILTCAQNHLHLVELITDSYLSISNQMFDTLFAPTTWRVTFAIFFIQFLIFRIDLLYNDQRHWKKFKFCLDFDHRRTCDRSTGICIVQTSVCVQVWST